MKLVISKIILSIVLFALYTYIIIFFASAQTLKTASVENILELETMRMLIENDKSVEKFLDSQIQMNIYMSEQEYSIFSNPIYTFYMLKDDKTRLCDTVLRSSNNTDVQEFLKRHCEKDK